MCECVLDPRVCVCVCVFLLDLFVATQNFLMASFVAIFYTTPTGEKNETKRKESRTHFISDDVMCVGMCVCVF